MEQILLYILIILCIGIISLSILLIKIRNEEINSDEYKAEKRLSDMKKHNQINLVK